MTRWRDLHSADKKIAWQDKYWEASDDFDYKKLGSEKFGPDTNGNVWREFWRESMSKEDKLLNFEKTAEKWGSDGKGNEWQEKWGNATIWLVNQKNGQTSGTVLIQTHQIARWMLMFGMKGGVGNMTGMVGAYNTLTKGLND